MTQLLFDDTHDRQHRARLRELIADATGAIRVASAYVTERDLLLRAKGGEVHLLVGVTPQDIACGATKIDPLRALIKGGVEVRYLPNGPRMHAKVYVFDSSAVVTSANLTRNAFESNVEVGVEVSGVAEIVGWFDRLWQSASPLTVEQLAEWEQVAEQFRPKYVALNKQAAKAIPLPNQPTIHALSEDVNYFLCNTDRREGTKIKGGFLLEETMHNRGFAAAWTDFNYTTHMERVKPGDIICMYAKLRGVIGVGRAVGIHEVLEVGDPDRIRDNYDGEEWRVPVEWIAWQESAPFPWDGSQATFRQVTQKRELQKLRDGAKEHFTQG